MRNRNSRLHHSLYSNMRDVDAEAYAQTGENHKGSPHYSLGTGCDRSQESRSYAAQNLSKKDDGHLIMLLKYTARRILAATYILTCSCSNPTSRK